MEIGRAGRAGVYAQELVVNPNRRGFDDVRGQLLVDKTSALETGKREWNCSLAT